MKANNSGLRGQRPASKADSDLRDFLRKLFSSMPLSRIQLAEALEQKLGERVSLARLDSFTASTKQSARLPAYFLPALAELLDSDKILLHLARPCTQKQFEFAETVRELRRIFDELLWMPELNAKRDAHSSSRQSKTPHRTSSDRNGNGLCGR